MESPNPPKMVSVPHTHLFSTDDKIGIGQCFNLAHAEYCARMSLPNVFLDSEWIKTKTVELFKLKLETEADIGKLFPLK